MKVRRWVAVVVALVGEDGVPNLVGQREQDVLEERASVVVDRSRF